LDTFKLAVSRGEDEAQEIDDCEMSVITKLLGKTQFRARSKSENGDYCLLNFMEARLKRKRAKLL
jgi:hypothetical protein